MRLAEMITEVGYETDRTAVESRIKFWIQAAIDIAFSSLPKEARQKSATLTTVDGQLYVTLPADYADLSILRTSDQEALKFLSPFELFIKNKTSGSGQPTHFTFWNKQFLFSPKPDDAYVYTLDYHIQRPNIYVHNLIIEHQASMTNYVDVYVDEDGVEIGEGKLLFVSPTSADAKVLIQTADEHWHEVIIYHDTDAASKGVIWYTDENATNAWEKNFFISPTGADTIIKTTINREHSHGLKFIHNPDPAAYPDAANVAVFVDEDLADRSLRLAFISPTTENCTNELVHTLEGSMPGFWEAHNGVIYEFAVARGHRFNRNYEWAKEHVAAATGLMAMIIGNPVNQEGDK